MSEKKISDQTNPESRKSIPLDWSYAEALENTSHATFNKNYGLFINGSFTNYDKSQSFESINPANGEALYRCTEASESDVDSAVKAARAAFEGNGVITLAPNDHTIYIALQECFKNVLGICRT